MRDAAGVGVFFTTNTKAKDALMRHLYGPDYTRPPGLGVLILAGSVAGAAFWAGE